VIGIGTIKALLRAIDDAAVADLARKEGAEAARALNRGGAAAIVLDLLGAGTDLVRMALGRLVVVIDVIVYDVSLCAFVSGFFDGFLQACTLPVAFCVFSRADCGLGRVGPAFHVFCGVVLHVEYALM